MQHLPVLCTIINPRFVQCDGEERPDRNHCQSMESPRRRGTSRWSNATRSASWVCFCGSSHRFTERKVVFSQKNIQRFFTTHNNQTPARQQPHRNQTIAKQQSNNTEATFNEKSNTHPGITRQHAHCRQAAARQQPDAQSAEPNRNQEAAEQPSVRNHKQTRRQAGDNHTATKQARPYRYLRLFITIVNEFVILKYVFLYLRCACP